MSVLSNKIDFAIVFRVEKANPNGDPLNGNRPRENYDGHGEVSDVCLKRKIRNRMQDMGYEIFVQSDDRNTDGFDSLYNRANGAAELKAAGKDKADYAKAACDKWIDVRAFGQVFAFSSNKKGDVYKRQYSYCTLGPLPPWLSFGFFMLSRSPFGPYSYVVLYSDDPSRLTSLCTLFHGSWNT